MVLNSNTGLIDMALPPSQLLYRRALVLDLPFKDESYDYILNTYGGTYLYPSSMAVDEAAKEIFVIRSPSGVPGTLFYFISVYDLTTGAYKSCFGFDSTGNTLQRENMVITKEGANRYLWVNNTGRKFDKFDITTLPADRALVVPLGSFGEDSYAQFAYDGRNWLVMQRDSRVTQQRHIFHYFDKDWKRGARVQFDRGLFGNISDSVRSLLTPKSQGIAYHKGLVYAGHGGIYAATGDDEYRYTPYRRHGISAHSPQGHCLAVALEDPELHRAKVETLVGRECGASENEGLSSSGSTLYSIWNTLSADQRSTEVAAQGGIVIFRELAADGIDFSDCALSFTSPFDPEQYASQVHRSRTQLTDPLTGDELTNFGQIGAMMRDLDVGRYSFVGDDQSLDDNHGNVLLTESRLFEFILLNNTDFQVTSRFRNEVKVWVCNTSGVQLGPYTPLVADNNGQVIAPGALLSTGPIRPLVDSTISCGLASRRWTVVYAATGTISTSDARDKTDVKTFTDAEIAAAKCVAESFGTYQWLRSIDSKGESGARKHVGQTVQNVMNIMRSHGLDPFRYAFLCSDTAEDGSERYGFRYDQLALFAIRGLAERINELELERK